MDPIEWLIGEVEVTNGSDGVQVEAVTMSPGWRYRMCKGQIRDKSKQRQNGEERSRSDNDNHIE